VIFIAEKLLPRGERTACSHVSVHGSHWDNASGANRGTTRCARLLDGTTFRLSAPLTNKGGLEPTGDWRHETED
jgi:hypothetical protein